MGMLSMDSLQIHAAEIALITRIHRLQAWHSYSNCSWWDITNSCCDAKMIPWSMVWGSSPFATHIQLVMNTSVETHREQEEQDFGTEELGWENDAGAQCIMLITDTDPTQHVACCAGWRGETNWGSGQSWRAESWCPLSVLGKNHQLSALCDDVVTVKTHLNISCFTVWCYVLL